MTPARPWTDYATWVFDCDGVLLDSNRAKSEAMYQSAAELFGAAPAAQLVAYHQAHGGVSRVLKFRHFFTTFLGRTDDYEADLAALMARYSERVVTALRTCAVAPGLEPLLAALTDRGVRCHVLSGAEQDELRGILADRGLAHWFQGIFGSPTPKEDVLAREIAAGTMPGPRLFLGDSRYDHQAARARACDFVFVSAWTEFADWRSYVAAEALPVIPDLSVAAAALTGLSDNEVSP